MTADQAIAQLTSLLDYEQRTENALICSDEWDEERKAVLHETEADIEALKMDIEALGGTVDANDRT